MGVTTTKTNKPFNPRGNDQSPLAYNKAAIYSGKALDFDGVNDEVDVSNITDTYKSLSFYINADNPITSASGFQRLFGIYQLYFGISSGSSTGSVTGETLTFMPSGGGRFGTKMNFEGNTWYHIAVVAKESDNTYLMYVNAQDKTDFSLSSHTPSAATKIKLGSAINGSGYFNGKIANFKAFNTALTPAQVADLYNFPEKIVPTGVANTALKLWLPMQEGAGTTAYNGAPLAALGGNIVRNKNFATDSEWNKESGWSISGGCLVATSASGTAAYQTGNGLVSGKTYKVEFEIKDYTTGAVGLRAGTGSSLVTFNTNGVHSINMVASGALQIRFDVSGSTTLKVDNVSVQEVNPSRNHGTISGATYVNGVGAPVAQTAVIDWNKGTNNLIKTEDYTNSSYWSQARCTPTSSSIRVPNADENSVLITESSSTGTHGIYNNGPLTIAANDTYTMSAFAKAGTRNWIVIDHFTGSTNHTWFDLSTGSVGTTGSGATASIRDVGDGWYQCIVTRTTTTDFSIYIGVYLSTGDGVSSYAGASGTGYFYGLSITQGSSATYVPNPTTTSITSEVLLPAGLTTGRDITGVNLFENVRKQGALNLDGNSWAKVHDNASLDIVDEVTLELWYYHKETSNISQLIGKRKNGDANWLRIYSASTNTIKLERGPSGAASGNFVITENAWNHITATIDSSDNMKFYIGGTQVGSASSFAPWGLNTTGVLSIGAWINNGNVTANSIASGQIAQPRIYNRALSAEEIQRNFDAGKNIYS